LAGGSEKALTGSGRVGHRQQVQIGHVTDVDDGEGGAEEQAVTTAPVWQTADRSRTF
jgi:hypothetical protein